MHIVVNGRRVMRIEAAAQILGVSEVHIYNLINSGLLEKVKVGNTNLYYEDKVWELKRARDLRARNRKGGAA